MAKVVATALCVPFLLLAAGCGKRHVSAAVEVTVHLRVVDAQTGKGIAGTEALAGGGHTKDPVWRADQITEHERDPQYRIMGISGYGITDAQGNATIRYSPHMSWMEYGMSEGAPGACLLTHIWVNAPSYESRVVEVRVDDPPVWDGHQWAFDVAVPDVTLTPAAR